MPSGDLESRRLVDKADMSKSQSHRSRRYVIAATLMLLLLLLFWPAIGSGTGWWAFWTGNSNAQAYPQAWAESHLPEIPEGEVVTSSDAPGDTSFEVVTTLQPYEVGQYLEREFGDREWESRENGHASRCGGYQNQFVGDWSIVQVTAQPDPAGSGKTRVTLAISRQSLMKRRPAGLTSTGQRVFTIGNRAARTR